MKRIINQNPPRIELTLEAAETDIKTVIIIVFHMFKKLSRNMKYYLKDLNFRRWKLYQMGSTVRLHIAEKLVKLEGKTIENNQNETQREKKKENSKI